MQSDHWFYGLFQSAPDLITRLLQMHSKPGFLHRLAAQCFRFLQLHPHLRHLAVVVVLPHGRLRLAP